MPSEVDENLFVKLRHKLLELLGNSDTFWNNIRMIHNVHRQKAACIQIGNVLSKYTKMRKEV